MKTKVPRIPRFRVADQGLQRFIDAVTETFEVREGRRGDRLDGNVTWRDMLEAGFGQLPGTAHGAPLEPADPGTGGGGLPDMAIPPAPEGVFAAGAVQNIMIGWANAPYANHSHTEVWRAAVDNLGSAVQIGTASAFMYADAVGPGVGYFYWVRFVSTSSVPGPYNAVAGTYAETGIDVQYTIDLLTGDNPDVPLVEVPVDTTIDGIFVPAGVYVRQAWIQNGTITNAKIANAAIDNAKIVDATIMFAKIVKGDIFDLTIGNEIKSSNYVAGSTGWRVLKSGSAEFSNVTVRGHVIATTGSIADAVSIGGGGKSVSQVLSEVDGANASITDWTRPGSTLINGNKIFTGDAYVDTLQIKGEAVTVPRSYFAAAEVSVGTLGNYTVVATREITLDTAANVIVSGVVWIKGGGTLSTSSDPVVIYCRVLAGATELQFKAMTWQPDGSNFNDLTMPIPISLSHYQGAGSTTYTIEINRGSTATASFRVFDRSLNLIGAQR